MTVRPRAGVIPAPTAYIKVVAVRTPPPPQGRRLCRRPLTNPRCSNQICKVLCRRCGICCSFVVIAVAGFAVVLVAGVVTPVG